MLALPRIILYGGVAVAIYLRTTEVDKERQFYSWL